MGSCLSDAVGGDDLAAIKKDIAELRAALDTAKTTIVGLVNGLEKKVEDVKKLEQEVRAEVDATKTQLLQKVEAVKSGADTILKTVEEVKAKTAKF
jgi:hypothetical protein